MAASTLSCSSRNVSRLDGPSGATDGSAEPSRGGNGQPAFEAAQGVGRKGNGSVKALDLPRGGLDVAEVLDDRAAVFRLPGRYRAGRQDRTDVVQHASCRITGFAGVLSKPLGIRQVHLPVDGRIRREQAHRLANGIKGPAFPFSLGIVGAGEVSYGVRNDPQGPVDH